MPNFLITNNLALPENYSIVELDGNKTQTLRGFYEEIADALAFPEEFGFTLDELDEMLSDLSWLEDEKIVLYISPSDVFIEKERNPEKTGTLLNLLDAICEDWRWADDEEDLPKKELIFAFSESARIKELLTKQEITFRSE
ncbi:MULTISPECIES: barstar family protein [unclassified Emticicia]|uniref:barstar family protein n=1 Tax=unclassified Emticicia TaxID=2627301 RepID=UPI000C78A4B7|nr:MULTISPECIES: barstar family protein [unclassified Emticicia]PLK46149.1 barnase inhibitor [Emticicia sp. TH156]UTA67927.1 barstar family protein [Emticicia sp. 21SJ11W-3]